MARKRSPRSSYSAAGGPRIPSLGDTLWAIRDEFLKLSREKAHARHGVSSSYLATIEVNGYIPSLETLDKIIVGYESRPALARHLRELRGAPETLAPLSTLRDCVTGNALLMDHLKDLERRDIVAAYVDPLWNILSGTDQLRAHLPGIEDSWSVPVWTFSTTAQKVIQDWEHEATHTIATLKPVLGRYRDSEQARQLIHRLRPNKEFQRLWRASIDVAYNRSSNDLLHVRNPITGERESYLLAASDVDESANVQLLTSIRKPYTEPAD